LSGCTFEESAASSGKKGITAEEFAGFVCLAGGKVVGDMGFGVSGNEKDLSGTIGEGDVISLL
jgi:hypothetical protein